jgi:hypothetical protein
LFFSEEVVQLNCAPFNSLFPVKEESLIGRVTSATTVLGVNATPLNCVLAGAVAKVVATRAAKVAEVAVAGLVSASINSTKLPAVTA